MGSIQDGLAVIQTTLRTWATAQLGSESRLWLPGEPFTRPAPDASDPVATSWARLTIPRAENDAFGVASSRQRRDIPAAVLQVFSPKGGGQAILTTLVETARTALDALNDNPWTADLDWAWVPLDDSGPWMQVNLEFTYQYQYTEAAA